MIDLNILNWVINFSLIFLTLLSHYNKKERKPPQEMRHVPYSTIVTHVLFLKKKGSFLSLYTSTRLNMMLFHFNNFKFIGIKWNNYFPC